MGAGLAMTGFVRSLGALAVTLSLAGCGSGPETGANPVAAIKAMIARPTPQPPPTGADINRVLAATTGPLILVTRGDGHGWATMLRIEGNGAHDTYGTADRRTLTMRNGIVTATRGLGGDLMSSDISGTEALILSRRTGDAPRIMRFLDGEDRTQTIRFDCDVSLGRTQSIEPDTAKSNLQLVTESCANGALRFANTYLVDRQGRLVRSRQWIGAQNGHLRIEMLRSAE